MGKQKTWLGHVHLPQVELEYDSVLAIKTWTIMTF